ncbi:metallophosphoesterase N-terminal domain-containing protein [Algoriphagus boritolerans]|uniref:metallophosphoesterase N-terminal domain-containing protein n=1 Tax=Algoriphagus boritolerans TaxID=308111 RepID=UPI000B262578
MTNGQGVQGVAVSDGRMVAQSNSSGEFELISGTDRDFVFVSLPAGYEIQKQANGSASFFQRIDPTKSEQNISLI